MKGAVAIAALAAGCLGPAISSASEAAEERAAAEERGSSERTEIAIVSGGVALGGLIGLADWRLGVSVAALSLAAGPAWSGLGGHDWGRALLLAGVRLLVGAAALGLLGWGVPRLEGNPGWEERRDGGTTVGLGSAAGALLVGLSISDMIRDCRGTG
ncbi:MAG: hypothetical protein R6V85_08925 [Polyangia bacterium]